MEPKIKTHKFTEAGLGTAPFRLVKNYEAIYQACPGAPKQPGAMCDYCGAGLMNVFVIQSADGKRFKVGCECVNKTGDDGVINLVKKEVRKRNNERRKAREAVKIEQLKKWMEDESIRNQLNQMPHFYTDMAKKGMKMLGYAEWMMKNAGNAGKIRIWKMVKELI